MKLRCIVALCGATVCGVFAQSTGTEKLRLRYFHDKNDERLIVTDLRFLTAKRAVGFATLISDDRLRGAMVASNDGGTTWTVEPFREVPRSDVPRAVSFLNDSQGWMATQNSIWYTDEGGRSWKKLKNQKGVLDIHFLDATQGFASGWPKLLLRTKDGGKNWIPVPEAERLATRPENSALSIVSFANGKNGVVTGASIPPRRGFSRMPAWMDPEEAKLRPQRPTVLLSLETKDGGDSWKPATASIFGRPLRVALEPNGLGFLIFQFDDLFDWRSEVYRLTGGGKTSRVYREKDRVVTDVLIHKKSGAAYLAVVEPVSSLPGLPIPGRVHLLRAVGPAFTLWQEIPVDYRASALTVKLAEAPDGGVWAATDEGMILSLQP